MSRDISKITGLEKHSSLCSIGKFVFSLFDKVTLNGEVLSET